MTTAINIFLTSNPPLPAPALDQQDGKLDYYKLGYQVKLDSVPARAGVHSIPEADRAYPRVLLNDAGSAKDDQRCLGIGVILNCAASSGLPLQDAPAIQ
jgi:hypothetical protein